MDTISHSIVAPRREEQITDAKCTRPCLPLVKGLAPRLLKGGSPLSGGGVQFEMATIVLYERDQTYLQVQSDQTRSPATLLVH